MKLQITKHKVVTRTQPEPFDETTVTEIDPANPVTAFGVHAASGADRIDWGYYTPDGGETPAKVGDYGNFTAYKKGRTVDGVYQNDGVYTDIEWEVMQ